MATTTFDTHRFIRRLTQAGIAEEQAEALSDAFRDAQGEAELATKHDLEILKQEVLGELRLVKWQLGVLLGGVIAVLLKLYF